jgi:hypothetical protein
MSNALSTIFALSVGNRQHVDRLVEARVRVEVRAELHAHALEIVDQVVLGEVLGAVERHVLDEVREAELGRVLEHRAGVHHEPQLGALGRAACSCGRSSAGPLGSVPIFTCGSMPSGWSGR